MPRSGPRAAAEEFVHDRRSKRAPGARSGLARSVQHRARRAEGLGPRREGSWAASAGRPPAGRGVHVGCRDCMWGP
eukprot:8345454-Lingulodinium_polyedra.AAC.1